MCDLAVNLLDAGFCRRPFFLSRWPTAPSGIAGLMPWSFSSGEGSASIWGSPFVVSRWFSPGYDGVWRLSAYLILPISLSLFRRCDLSDLCLHLSDLK
jgi:hypothetical protein